MVLETPQAFSVVVPCRMERMDEVTPLLEDLCAGADALARDQILTAFNEAFVNVVKHSQLGEDETLEVSASRDEATVVVKLIDGGVPFDYMPGVLEPPLLSESGMGLFIIQSYMSEVTYEIAEYNVLTMTRHLQGDEEAQNE